MIAATTNTAGNHTHGACAIHSFAGSLWNTRIGVGVESTAIVRMFARRTIPAAFQTRATATVPGCLTRYSATPIADNPVSMSKLNPE